MGIQPLHPVKHLRIYRAAVTKTRDRRIELLKIVAQYPYLESRKFTFTYSEAALDTDEGIRYNAYMHCTMDTIMELFEESHCVNFPGNPCDHLCAECIERVKYGFDIKSCLTTHMTWWLVHAPYFEDMHPIFARFVHQIIQEELEDIREEILEEHNQFK